MNTTILKTYNEISQWFIKNDISTVSFDTETTSLNYIDMKLLGMSFCNGKEVCYIDLSPGKDAIAIKDLLNFHFMESIQTLIMHNAPFDLKVLYKYGITDPTSDIFDTMTAAHLLDENGPKGLKELALIKLGYTDAIPFSKAIVNGPSSDMFYKYASNDAMWTWELYTKQRVELRTQNLEKLFYNVEMPFQYVLRDLAINGVLVDTDKLSKAQEDVNKLLWDTELEIYKTLVDVNVVHTVTTNLLGEEEICSSLNLDSPKQVSAIIEKLGLDVEYFTDSGQIVTAKYAMEGLKNQHPFIPLMLKYRKLSKLKSSFLDALPRFIDPDGRIRPDFSNIVAVTGRVICSHPNLMTLPRDNKDTPASVRECLIAPEGKKFIVLDYSGQELRVLAIQAHDKKMIEALQEGKDLHLTTAKEMFNLEIPEECLYTNHPEHEFYKNKFKDERDKAKTVNFGISYGKTPMGFAKDWNVPVKEAEDFIEKYFSKFPAIRKAISKCRAYVKNYFRINNLAGRRRRFKLISNRAFRQAFNFLIQGFSADISKAGCNNVRRVLLNHLEWAAKFILVVHDEIVIEIKEKYVNEAMPLIKAAAESVFIKELAPVGMKADISFGGNYSEAK